MWPLTNDHNFTEVKLALFILNTLLYFYSNACKHNWLWKVIDLVGVIVDVQKYFM